MVQHGAVGIVFKYEQGTGRIEGLQFAMLVDQNTIPFSLPVHWRLFQAVLKEQKVSKWRDEDYCYRVAWANVRDWIASQMAFYETRMVTIPQIFLPYAITKDGKTLYEKISENPDILMLK